MEGNVKDLGLSPVGGGQHSCRHRGALPLLLGTVGHHEPALALLIAGVAKAGTKNT